MLSFIALGSIITVLSVLQIVRMLRVRRQEVLGEGRAARLTLPPAQALSAVQATPALQPVPNVQFVPSEPPRRSAVCTDEEMRLILGSDPLIAQIALQRSGLGHLRPDDVFDDPEALIRVIRQIPELIFQILYVAATQNDVSIDCRPIVTRNPTMFPSEPEPGCYRDASQFPDILFEDMALDDDQFYARLATHELRVLEQFEVQGNHKVLYLLLDVSGSMKESITGRPYSRHIWARGVAVKQIVQALRGEATYFMRYFADSPGRLHRAVTEAEAQMVIDNLFEVDFSDQGTNIQRALEIAAADIKECEADCAQAEILLLSDGESGLDLDKLQKEFGARVRLHVVLIGDKESDSLKRLSATYLKL